MVNTKHKFKGKQEYIAFLKWYKDNKKELYNMYYSVTDELDETEFINLIVSIWHDIRVSEYVQKN